MKKTVYLLSLISLFVTASHAIALPENDIENFEAKKYQGLWYEIARLPNRFQAKCKKNVTATYTLLKDGNTEIFNQCEKEGPSIMTAKGLARQQGTMDPAKLEVSFFTILGWRPVWSDSWILYIDPDYTMSVVGDRKKEYGWILSRKKTLSKEKLDLAKSIFIENGYNLDPLLFTEHSNKGER